MSMDTDDDWNVEYGQGGWVRITGTSLSGWLYLRLAFDERGRPFASEAYLDGQGTEVTAATLRNLPLSALVEFAAAGDERALLGRLINTPGPDLSRLASNFATSFGRKTRHWVRDSYVAQINGQDVPQAPMGRAPRRRSLEGPPPPLAAPDRDGLTDAFLELVAAHYLWKMRHGGRPAPALSSMAGVSERTVHGWVRKARQRGILPPAAPRGAGRG